MAARQSPRSLPAATPDEPPTPDAIAELHLAQGEPARAAAALLPALDAAAESGHAPSRAAAALIRTLTAPEAPRDPASPPGPAPTEDHLVASLGRLTALLRKQDTQLAQMQAMLEALL